MFYDIFLELCNEKGVTPAQVRKDLSISQSTMASWKSRGLNPNASTIIQLANYFQTTPSYLLGNRMAKKTVNMGVIQEDSENDDFSEKEIKRQMIMLANSIEKAKLLDMLHSIERSFFALNDSGRQKAVERVEELTEIPKYQRKLEEGDSDAVDPKEND